MRFLKAACAAALLWPAAAGAQTSAEMSQRIAGALRDSGQLVNYRVGVKYNDGVAWLLGSVTNADQAVIAEQVASRVAGVDHVINRISVAPGQPQAAAQRVARAPLPQAPFAAPAPMAPKPAPKMASRPTASGASRKAAKRIALEQPSQVLDAQPIAKAAPVETAAPAPIQQAELTLAMNDQPTTPQGFSPAPEAKPTPTPTPEAAPATATRAPSARVARRGMPRPMRRVARQQPAGVQNASYAGGCYSGGGGYAGGGGGGGGYGGAPVPQGYTTGGAAGVSYDQANMPGYAWPSYAAYPNYAAVSYPQQYSPSAWPYIGPFHPYPQVPLGWRKVTLEWDDGWWFLDFSHQKGH